MTSVYLFFIWGCCGSRTFRGYMQSCKRVTLPSIRILAVHLFRYGFFFSSRFAFFKNLLRKLFIIGLYIRTFVSIGYVIVVTFGMREKGNPPKYLQELHTLTLRSQKYFKGNEIDIYWYINCY